MWHLKGSPYEVQTVAANRSRGEVGFAYFMEMGLGKTAVTLNEFMELVINEDYHGLAVILPNTLKINWIEEAIEWGLEDKLTLVMWPNIPKSTDKPWLWVINYEAFSVGRAKGYDELVRIAKVCKVMMAADESIVMKKHNGKKTVKLIDVAKYSPCRRILSGAPVSQGPHDLWAQLRFIGRTNMNYYAFRHRYCKMGGFRGKQVVGAQNEEELNRLLQSCSFRAKKSDWTDLPPKLFQRIKYELSDQQKRHYVEMERDFITFITGLGDELSMVEAKMVVTQMGKLQQITCGFIHDEEGNPVRIKGPCPKYDLLKTTVEGTEGKILNFVFHRHTIDMMEEFMTKDKIPFVTLRGQMEPEEISSVKKQFNSKGGPVVMNCQITSTKYGNTLLGDVDDRCNTSFFFENTYDYDARIQCEDRNHRHGQDKDVLIIDPYSSPIEEAATAALLRKDGVAKSIVDGVKNGLLEGS